MFLTQNQARKALQAVIDDGAPDTYPQWLAPLVEYMGATERNELGIANSMVSVAQHVSTLGQGALEFDHRINGLVEKIQTLSAAIEEMSASAVEVGSLGQDVLQQASSVNNYTKESTEALDDMEAKLAEVDTVLTRANEEMKALAAQTKRIESLTNVVNEISDQTNLLALNAAIEAARAGDVGRGFAVVADEVRQLASRSSGAASEINGIVSDIISGSESVQARLANSVEAVQLSGQSRERVAEVIRRARESSVQNVDLASSIASAAEEQSQVSGDMACQVSANSEDSAALGRIFQELVSTIAPLRHNNDAGFEYLQANSPQMALATAKHDHVVWVDKIIRFAIFNEPAISASEIRDHTQCRLGEFLITQKAAGARGLKGADTLINQVHPQVHKVGRELYEAAQSFYSGKLNSDRYDETSTRLVGSLNHSSEEVVALLDDMIAQLGRN